MSEKRVSVRCASMDAMTLRGQPIVYGSKSRDLGGFVEMFAPGAFREHLAKSPDVISCYNHDERMILGRTSAGTLRLADSDGALGVEIALPNTSYARDLAESVRRRDISHMSFAFDADEDEWDDDEDGDGKPFLLRTVRRARLHEVSPVASPAYLSTSVFISERSLHIARAHVRRRGLPMDLLLSVQKQREIEQ